MVQLKVINENEGAAPQATRSAEMAAMNALDPVFSHHKKLLDGDFWRRIPAYKDVTEVVHVVHDAGLAERVARIRPLGCVKG